MIVDTEIRPRVELAELLKEREFQLSQEILDPHEIEARISILQSLSETAMGKHREFVQVIEASNVGLGDYRSHTAHLNEGIFILLRSGSDPRSTYHEDLLQIEIHSLDKGKFKNATYFEARKIFGLVFPINQEQIRRNLFTIAKFDTSQLEIVKRLIDESDNIGPIIYNRVLHP